MRLDWFEKDIQLNLHLRPSGLLVALAYAVAFWAARQVSVDQWLLSAGIRVGALILFAPRFWPYLVAGEYAVFAYTRYPLIDQFGLAWAIVGSIFLMPAAAAIVSLHKRLIASGSQYWLLSVAGLTALCITALNLGIAWWLMPERHQAVSWTGALTYVVGDYLGILTFVPLVLLWKQRALPLFSSRGWKLEAILALALIAGLGMYAKLLPETDAYVLQKNSLRLLMILPALALTCLHGWRGAAIGVASLNLVVGLTVQSTGQPNSFDPKAFLAQEILAVVGTMLLALGATISYYYHKFKVGDQIGKHALAIARSNLIANEREMRERAIRMEIIGEDLDATLRNAARSLRENGQSLAAMDVMRDGVTHAQLLREQLIRVYPTGIERYGLYVTLEHGIFSGAWEQSGRLARPHLAGDPCRLGRELQVVAFRCICDAVALLLQCETGTIDVRARCGRRGAYRGIIINVSLLDARRTLSAETNMRALNSLMGRAVAFDGTVRCRHNRIRILLGEPVPKPSAYRVPSGASIDQMVPPTVS